MTTTTEWLSEQKPLEETVTVRGREFLVRGVNRVKRREIISSVTNAQGETNGGEMEALLLQSCVCDPGQSEPIKGVNWSCLPCDIVIRLADACMRVNGFGGNEDEGDEAKKSDEAQT